MQALWLTASIAIPLAAALLLFLGLRGRRINDHPTCAACRFDLIGLTTPATCPECGSPLNKPRAVRIGARHKRPTFIACGCAILVLTALAATALLVGSKIDPYKPSWLLILEADLRPPEMAFGVIAELQSRCDHNSLSAAAKANLARRALAVQTNPDLKWSREWQSILTDPAFVASLTPKEQEAAALAGSTPSLSYRKRVRSGHGIPIVIAHGVTDRFVGTGSRRCTVNALHLVVQDKTGATLLDWLDNTSLQSFSTHANSTTSRSWPVPAQLAPGVYRVTYSGELALPGVGASPAALQSLSITGDLTIVPADQPTVELLSDPTAAALFQSSVKISGHLSIYNATSQWLGMGIGFTINTNDAGSLQSWVRTNRVKCRYKATLLGEDNKPIPAGSLCLSVNDAGWVISPGGAQVPASFAPGLYSMHLEPDLEAAEAAIDDERILGDSVVIPIQVSKQK